MVKPNKTILSILLLLVVGVGSLFVTALATNKSPLSLISSIQVDDRKEVSETEETAQLAPLAKISTTDATLIALRAVNIKEVGEITNVQLENEEGNVVYAVEFTKNGIETDVKIDAGNGKVLLIEDDSSEADQDVTTESDFDEEDDK